MTSISIPAKYEFKIVKDKKLLNPLRARGAVRRHLKTFLCVPEVQNCDISGAPTKTGDVWEPAVFQYKSYHR